MGRYWSLEECCWVEYSLQTPDVAEASGADGDLAVSDQIPEQAPPSQREPAFI
jgi:hypothetical protein